MKARIVFIITSVAALAAADSGETTATFLTLGVGARAAAMGEAYAGLAEGVNALAYNPAGVAYLDAAEVSAMHAEWFQGLRYEYLAFAYPTAWGTFGGDARELSAGGLELRTDPLNPSPEPEGSFRATDIAVDISYAYALVPTLAVGLNAKGVNQKLYDVSANTLAGDVGVYWVPTPAISVGLAARNLGPSVVFEEARSPLPMTAEIGCGYKAFGRTVVMALAVEKPFRDRFLYKGGVEYNPARFLSGRAGYIYGLDAGGLTGLTGGLGVKAGGFSFDFAYAPYGDLGDTYRAGFTYAFGRERRRITEEVTARVAEEFEKQKREIIAALSAKANDYFAAGAYREAVDTWDLIMVWDPDNHEAAARLEQARDRLNEERVADHVAKGDAFLAAAKYSEAALEYGLAQKIDPTNAAAITGLAQAEEELAREEAREAAAIAKLLESARAAYGRGEYATAIKKWEQVLLLEPDNVEARSKLDDAQARVAALVAGLKEDAARYEKTGEWARAVDTWERILQLVPSDAEALAGRARARGALSRKAAELTDAGVAKYDKGDLDGAEAKFIAALNLEPGNSRAAAYLKKIKEKRAGAKASAKPDYTKVYLKGIQAYTNHQYRAAIAYWQQIPVGHNLYNKAKTNIKRAKAVLTELEAR